MNPISELFYNTIPGVVYLVSWILLFDSKLSFIDVNNSILKNEYILGLVFTSLALLLGFILQGIWRLYRRWNSHQCLKLKDEDLAREVFYNRKQNEINKYKEELEDINVILWLTKSQELSDYFSARSALFSNIFVGNIITFILATVSFHIEKIDHKTFLILMLICPFIHILVYMLYINYRKAQYGTIKRIDDIFKGKDFKQLYNILKSRS